MKILALLSVFVSIKLFAQVMDTDTPDTQYLTDEEVQYSQDFVHEGLSNQIIQKECEGIEQACKGQEMDDATFLGIPTEMMDLVGQAYNVMTAMGQSQLMLSPKAFAAARAKDPMARDYKPDHCAKIPMAADLLANFKQTSEQQNLANLPAEGDTVQKQELSKAAESHKIRSETSIIQATGYYTTTACYIAMVGFGGVAISSIAVKLPAVGILAAYHTTNAVRQNEMYDRIKKIADKLPGRGECNPITEKDCYCDTYRDLKKEQEKITKQNEAALEQAKKEGKWYEEKTVIVDEAGADQYCKPQLHAESLDADSMAVSCIDSKMQLDPFCKCKGQNNCYDQEFVKFTSDLTPEMYASSGLSDFSSMTQGELRGGKINGEGFARNAAKTKSLLKQYALENPAKGDLSPQALLSAKKVEETFGIPKELAANLTARPPTDADRDAIRKVTGDERRALNIRGDEDDKNQVLSFTQPSAPVRKNPITQKQQAENIKLQRGQASDSGNVLMFAEKAAAKAQIEQRPESNIFHLISKRYQLSAPRYLQIKGENQNAK